MNTDNPEVFILFIITICFGLFFFFKLVMSLFPNPLLAPHAIATHLEHHVADKRVLGATNHIFCLQLRQGNRLWGRLEERAQSPKLWDCPQLLWNRGHKPLPSPTRRKGLLLSKPSVKQPEAAAARKHSPNIRKHSLVTSKIKGCHLPTSTASWTE